MGKAWRRLHFCIGVLGLAAFLGTGQFMHIHHGHLEGMSEAKRMLFRASHIYILLASLINLALGIAETAPRPGIFRWIQRAVSTVAVSAPVLLVAGFFVEPHLDDLARPYTRPGLYALFGAGVGLIVLGAGVLFGPESADRLGQDAGE